VFGLPLAVKTIVAEVWQPTNLKRVRLREVIDAWKAMTQRSYLERRSAFPYLNSAYARNRFKSMGGDDPVYLTQYDVKISRTMNKHARIWVRIPYRPRSPIWLPLRMSKQNEANLFADKICGSRLVATREGRVWIHFTVTREVTSVQPRTVLAVDLGEKRLATTVLLDQTVFKEPRFYGKSARGIRRHYSWLRKRLAERKLLRVLKRVKDSERRKINTLLHQISRAIVEQAKENEALIIVGDLKGIRDSANSKHMNRIVSSMPYYRLTKQIEYKAAWEGIPVVRINERGTSRTCCRCGSTNTIRTYQSVFECRACGLMYNADLNAAKNIAKRVCEQRLQSRASYGSRPLTLPELNLKASDEERSRIEQGSGRTM